MNRQQYKVIFNKARGVLMAVAEVAKQAGKSATGEGARTQDNTKIKRTSDNDFDFTVRTINAIVLGCILTSTLLQPLQAYSQVRADSNAAGKNKATVIRSANGTVLVNIQTPNSAGVSRNIYVQFDVDKNGLIINNSRSDIATQLGGLVQGNPWLAQGQARVILNEVNSVNPSYLNGFIEIAGQKAELVIANPAGISVDGAGFINASKATLTTGLPQFNGDSLSGFSVQRGTININGAGLNSTATDFTNILAKAVNVNAGIWANTLNVIGGEGFVENNQNTVQSYGASGATGSYAIDVGQLGGMYAGKISLIGTDLGVGVRNAGQIGAEYGSVEIDSQGTIVNTGALSAQDQIKLKSQNEILNTGKVGAQGLLSIESIKGTIKNTGELNSDSKLSLKSRGSIENKGAIFAGNGASVLSQSGLSNSGTVNSNSYIEVNTGLNISNSGTIYAKTNTSLSAGTDILNSGLIASTNNTSLISRSVNGSIVSTAGSTLAAGLLPNGNLSKYGNLTLESRSSVELKGNVYTGVGETSSLQIKTGEIDVSGMTLLTGSMELIATKGDIKADKVKINTLKKMELDAAQNISSNQSLLSANALKITAGGNWNNQESEVLQVGTSDTIVSVIGDFNNQGSSIATNGKNLIVQANNMNNTEASIIHAGSGELKITTENFNNYKGEILSNGNLALNAKDVNSESSVWSATGAISIKADTGNIELSGSQIAAQKNISIDAKNDLNLHSSSINTLSALTLKANNIGAENSSWVATQDVKIDSQQSINAFNSSIGSAEGSINLNAKNDIDLSYGETLAFKNISIVTDGSIDNAAAQMIAQGNVHLSAGKNVYNENGVISALGNADINAGENFLSSGGQVQAVNGNLNIVANSKIDLSAGADVYSGQNLNLQSGQDLNLNDGSRLTSLGNLDAKVGGSLHNNNSSISAKNTINLTVAENFTSNNGQVFNESGNILINAGKNIEIIGSQAMLSSAGQISLTGGLNTNLNESQIVAKSQIEIKTQGDLLAQKASVIAGSETTSGTGNLTIQAGGSFNATQAKLYSLNGDVNLNAKNNLSLGGLHPDDSLKGEVIASVGNVSIQSELGNVQTSFGVISANKNLAINAKNDLQNEGGTLVANQELLLNADKNINNKDGTIASIEKNVIINSGESINNTAGAIQAKTSISIQAQLLNNTNKAVISGETLDVKVSGNLDNSKGVLAATGSVLLNASNLNNAEGLIQGQDNLKIVANTLNNKAGKIISTDSEGISNAATTSSTKGIEIDIKGELDNSEKGLIVSTQKLNIKADSINNNNTKTETEVNKKDADGKDVIDPVTNLAIKETQYDLQGLQGKDIVLESKQLLNDNGAVVANNSLLITLESLLSNDKGLISSTGALQIKDKLAKTDSLTPPAPLPENIDLKDDTDFRDLDNVKAKTLLVVNSGTIVSNKDMLIDVGVLKNTGTIVNMGTKYTVMQDEAGTQVRKKSDGSWVKIQKNGQECSSTSTDTACAGSIDANKVTERKVDDKGHKVALQSDGTYAKVDDAGQVIKENNVVQTVDSSKVMSAQELLEGSIKIKVAGTETFKQQSSGGAGTNVGTGTLVPEYHAGLENTGSGTIQAATDLEIRTRTSITNGDTTANGDKVALLQAGRSANISSLRTINNQLTGEINGGATQISANTEINNRGLIDGGLTLLQSNKINNIGTGRIYGDEIAVSAGVLSNTAEDKKGAVIAARKSMELGVALLENKDDSLILSLGDLNIGSRLDENLKVATSTKAEDKAKDNAQAVINSSATIEVLGNFNVKADVLQNTDGHATTFDNTTVEKIWTYQIDQPGHVTNGQKVERQVCPPGKTRFECDDFVPEGTDPDNPEYAYFFRGGVSKQSTSDPTLWDMHSGVMEPAMDWLITEGEKVTSESGVTAGKAARISVAKNMTVNSTDSVNYLSQMLVGGNLSVTGTNLQNIGATGSLTITESGTIQKTWIDQSGGGFWGGSDVRVWEDKKQYTAATISDNWETKGTVLYNTTVAINSKAKSQNSTASVSAQTVSSTAPNTENHSNNNSTSTASNTQQNNTVQSQSQNTKAANAKAVAPQSYVVRTIKVPAGKSDLNLPKNSLYKVNPGSASGYLVETDPKFTQNKTWLGSEYMLSQLDYDPKVKTKRLGDGFYEQSLIRDQVAQLTGNRFLDGFASEEEQFKALMSNGVTVAKQFGLKPGIALTPEQVATLTSDIVWMVEQTLEDGSKVLVPQVYAVVKPDDIDGNGNVLSAKTADLKLKGDLVNTGLLAARGNLNVKAENISNVAGTIKGQDISLHATGNLQSIQGTIDAANNLKLRSGADTTIVAGSIKAGGNADVNAGGDLTIVANNKGRVVNVAWGETEEERAGNYLIDAQYNETGTQIDIKGKLNMSAGGNLTAQGATINAAAIGAKAGNDIVVTGRRTGYQYESVLNSGDVSRTTKRTDLTNQLSNWNAGNISMNAGHDITLQGVNLNGANVNLAAGHNLSAIEVYDIKENVDINSSVSMFRQRVSIDINSERTAIGNSIGNGAGVVTRTAGNNILDRGTTIAGIAQSTIAGNRVSEEAIKSTIHQERTRTTGGAFWVSTQSQGSTQETLQMTNIFVPSNASRFQGGGGVSVQLPKGSDLRAQIDRLKGQPGNEYLGQLAERSDIDWQEVEVINKTWNYKKETMGPASAIIVAIGVSLLTGGVGGMASSFGGTVSGGLGLTGTVAGEIVAASASAGFSSLASMTATAVINNGGDLGAALEELGSSANVKSLLISMVTAGAIQGISDNIPVKLLDDKGKLIESTLSKATLQNATFAQLLGKNMVSAIASATISSAVNGGSFEDSVKAALISGFLDTAAASGANWIGDVTQDGKLSQTLAENFANKLMHGALGCAIGAAKANSEAGCASGAIGGVVGHLTAEAVKDLKLKDSEVLALGQITSVLAATLAQKDLNIANSSAQNAIANNYLSKKHVDKVRDCLMGKTCSTQEQMAKAMIDAEKLSKFNDDQMNTICKQNPTSDSCRTAVAAAIDYVALRDAWQYMNGDVVRSGGNMFDYLYNSNGARERFGLHLNTIDNRADFFDASHQWEQNEGIGARWFGGASQVSRAPITGLGADGKYTIFDSSISFGAGSVLPGDQYEWRKAAGDALISGGFDNFRNLYNGNYTSAQQWDINQLKNEQGILQPIHNQYLGNSGLFVWMGQSLTNSTLPYINLPNPLASSQTIPGGINILDYDSRVRYGCKLLGYTATQGCK